MGRKQKGMSCKRHQMPASAPNPTLKGSSATLPHGQPAEPTFHPFRFPPPPLTNGTDGRTDGWFVHSFGLGAGFFVLVRIEAVN